MPIPRRRFLAAALLGPLALLPARPARAAAHIVTIRNFGFSPARLSVAPGDTVTFRNADRPAHTATSVQEGVFDTGRLARGEAQTVTVNFRGTARYYCRYHPLMRGALASA